MQRLKSRFYHSLDVNLTLTMPGELPLSLYQLESNGELIQLKSYMTRESQRRKKDHLQPKKKCWTCLIHIGDSTKFHPFKTP